MEAEEAKKTRTTKSTSKTTSKSTTAKKTTTTRKTTAKSADAKASSDAKTTASATKTTTRRTTKKAEASKADVKEVKEVATAPKAETLATNKAKRKAKKAKLLEEKRLAPSATLKNARISARKVKIVIDNIRGKNVNEAIAILKFTPKAASPLVEKLLKSAIANAENNNMMDRSKLYVAEVYANQGTTMKRIRAATQGRANRIRKRTSHITIVLRERA